MPYSSEPYSDFADPVARTAYELALAGVGEALGADHPITIGGDHVTTGTWIDSVDPSLPPRLVGRVAAADAASVDRAIETAWQAYVRWSAVPAAERRALVTRLGEILRDRKYEFSAWETYEAGKNWAEAEADVAEAIDFCMYYAEQAVEMDRPVPVLDWPGEINESWLQPIGAGVVIPPWNFPLAILCGMAIGPVAAGNTVVVKPASNTPVIAAIFMDAVLEAGIPPGVVNLLPGGGGDIGDALVDHPRTRFVNFTGSKEIGLRIAERAAKVHPGQKWLKRSFMEMGGKDGLIVDETADLAAAADAAVRSAFGFQGQKCSACSRLILVDAIHDEVLDAVIEATSRLVVGPAAGNHPVGPVISAAQRHQVLGEISKGRAEATIVAGGDAVDMDGGYFIEPTIFAGVEPHHRLAQHEIFGPVLSVIRAADFADALAIANGTEFGLTGGLFSSDPVRIERARREFHVGNLYVNRKITGALVGIQPFGGFNMSGSNSKAGGPDYLRLFMEMKTIAQRIV